MTLSIRPIDDGSMGAVVTGWRPEAELGDDEVGREMDRRLHL